jgi:hypothetical protein
VTPTRRRGAVIAAVVAAAVLVGAVVIIVRSGGSDHPPVAASTTTSTSSTSTQSPSTSASSPAPSGTPAPATTGRTATGDLAPFLSAAARADTRLKAAAAAVNSRIVGDEVRVDQTTTAAVRSARDAVTAAGRIIPAGLAPDLLRAVLLVQSGLISRDRALNPAWSEGTVALAAARPCFRNGSAAAARYGSDLGNLRARAQAAPPVTVASPDSREAEELAIRLGEIDLRNSGCDSCGGYIATQLSAIKFYAAPRTDPAIGNRWDGTIGDQEFRADFQGDAGWKVEFNAC